MGRISLEYSASLCLIFVKVCKGGVLSLFVPKVIVCEFDCSCHPDKVVENIWIYKEGLSTWGKNIHMTRPEGLAHIRFS